jgi:hypothetical protein
MQELHAMLKTPKYILKLLIDEKIIFSLKTLSTIS